MSETAEIAIITDQNDEAVMKMDISQHGISQRQLLIIDQLASVQNLLSEYMNFAHHLDKTLAALVESNNEIGSSQTDMQKTVTNIFASAQNSPMAKMLFGKGGKQDG